MFSINRLAPAFRSAPSASRAFGTSAARSQANISIVGRLGAAPELRVSTNGREYVRYVVGSSSRGGRETSWFRIVSFSETSKDHLMSLPKGTLIALDGEAVISAAESAEGQRTYNFSVIQRAHEVLQRPKNQEGESESASGAESQEPPQ